MSNVQIILNFIDECLKKIHKPDPELVKKHNVDPVPFGNNLMWYMISTLLPIKEKLRRTDWLAYSFFPLAFQEGLPIARWPGYPLSHG